MGTGSTTHPLPDPVSDAQGSNRNRSRAEHNAPWECHKPQDMILSWLPRQATWSHQSTSGQIRTARALGSLQEEETSSHDFALLAPAPQHVSPPPSRSVAYAAPGGFRHLSASWTAPAKHADVNFISHYRTACLFLYPFSPYPHQPPKHTTYLPPSVPLLTITRPPVQHIPWTVLTLSHPALPLGPRSPPASSRKTFPRSHTLPESLEAQAVYARVQ